MDIQEQLSEHFNKHRTRNRKDKLCNAFSYDSINCVRFEGYKSQSVSDTPKAILNDENSSFELRLKNIST